MDEYIHKVKVQIAEWFPLILQQSLINCLLSMDLNTNVIIYYYKNIV